MNFDGFQTEHLESESAARIPGLDLVNPEMSILVLSVRTFLGVVAVLGNGVFLFVFLNCRPYRKQFSNVLITLLALADCVSGIGTLIKTAHSVYQDSGDNTGYNRFPCVLAGALKVVAMFWSHIMFISIAADRLMAVKMMMKYSLLTFRPRLLIIFISWVLSALFVCSILFGTLPEGNSVSCAVAVAAGPIFNLFYVGGGILMGAVLFAVYVYALYSLKTITARCHRNTSRLKSQQNVFKSVTVLIFFNFLLCVLPMFAGLLVTALKLPKNILAINGIVLGLGSEINSCVGIFIYYLKHEEFKKCVKILFLKERGGLSFTAVVVPAGTVVDNLQRSGQIAARVAAGAKK